VIRLAALYQGGCCAYNAVVSCTGHMAVAAAAASGSSTGPAAKAAAAGSCSSSGYTGVTSTQAQAVATSAKAMLDAVVQICKSAWSKQSHVLSMPGLCAVLGMEAGELILTHSMEEMMACCDFASGGFKSERLPDGKPLVLPMSSWPCLGSQLEAWRQLLWWGPVRALLPSFVYPTNMGVLNMFNRRKMLAARCAKLPGYVVNVEEVQREA